MELKIGDQVKVKLWNGSVIGRVLKVVGRAVFIDKYDAAGLSLCVDAKCVSKVPSLSDIGYAQGAH